MGMEYAPVDIGTGNVPDLADLAEEVRRTNRPRVLRRAGEDIAIIAPMKRKPMRSPFKMKSRADIDALLSAAGGWKEVDTDRLKADIYESRRMSTKLRPDL